MLPVTIGDQASIDAALAREKGDALFDARHRFVLSFGYELPRLDRQRHGDQARARRLAVERHRPGADRVSADGDRAEQRRRCTSLTNRPNLTCDPNEDAAHTTDAVVQHGLLPAPDARGERRTGRQRRA